MSEDSEVVATPDVEPTRKGNFTESGLPIGPIPDLAYPVNVLYCGNCGLPTEYCEYYPDFEKCKTWLEKNLPDAFAERFSIEACYAAGKLPLIVPNHLAHSTEVRALCHGPALDRPDPNAEGAEDDKKRQKRGGKGLVKPRKKEEGPKKICLSLSMRGKKKLTVITGLKSYGIDLKVAAKFFGTKFACGSSVTGEDEIVVQGDIKDDLFDVLPEKWPEIDEDNIDDLGEVKR